MEDKNHMKRLFDCTISKINQYLNTEFLKHINNPVDKPFTFLGNQIAVGDFPIDSNQFTDLSQKSFYN